MEPRDKVWTEKYRPKKIKNMVGNFKEKILKYLENSNTMPHFLLYRTQALVAIVAHLYLSLRLISLAALF